MRSIRTILFSSVVMLATTLPAGAQTLGAGLSFLEGGIGVTIDYAKAYKTLTNDRSLHWVGDVSFHHDGAGAEFVDASLNILTIQGGLRMKGKIDEKLSWHVQGLVGIMRASVSVSASGLTEDLCDALDIDCEAGASDTGVVVSPGAGIDYAFNDRRSLRVQLDIPFDDGGSATRFWVGLSMKLGS
jgi:hypothetical protein